ncbi:MAG: DNA-3-methyladenine glycosylase I [Acetobacter sp.]|jgi:DNA-3-methyladenine glycosylase I|nr:DNA-3-methyladenine glycosylase I [Acetobacter sp.]MCH4060717.1 DNA-3-methyladenine glycosylase I [Acetobacter sp.]MCH4087657.1 DNA-3-methyladenine glycosylase I [Acetobacter sp.]MCI1294221.1 DNA-3-methyladenine glycosylase I [Acetobacter sp.]MCI1320806.1 DNA-3-methyladenine glycosylase I [Acetobacter sp.]
MTPPLHRCRWAQNDLAMQLYHDTEWGVPVRDSRALWEKLILDGFQAGLSWRTILLKREAFREAFEGFIPARVAHYGETDIERLLGNPAIVRSRIKIRAAIKNANAYLSMQEQGEDFSSFVWGFVSNSALRGDGTGSATRSVVGNRLSIELKKRGFSFVGPVIVHAWLQATGVINDHESSCFRQAYLVHNDCR